MTKMPKPLSHSGRAMGCSSSPHNPSSSSHLSFFLLLFMSLSLFCPCNGQNSLSQGQVLRDGETLVSSMGTFELGFFSPGNSTLRFVGIWYRDISVESVVWVANRENPLSDKNGVLTIGSNGSLVILDGSNSSVWSSSNSSSSSSQFTNSTAILMDTGNLILYPTEDTNDSSGSLWQSLQHPTDTYLPSMRVRVNSAMGENRAFTSWKSDSDPSRGNYSMGVDPRGTPQIVIWEGSIRRWRSGHWNGLIFLGVPNMTANYLYGFRLSSVESDGSTYFTYTPLNTSDLLRFRISWEGREEMLRWDATGNEWTILQSEPVNECEKYNWCGDFGICNIKKSPNICSCMDGFTPKYAEEWKKGNWTGGCVRKTELGCGKNTSSSLEEGGGDGFLEIEGVKLPDFADIGSAKNANDCEANCLNNCSCYAFSYLSTVGCFVWSGDLIDVQHFESGGRTLFVRVAGSELASRKISTILIIVLVVIGSFLFCVSLWLLWRFKEDVKACSILCCGSRKNELPLFDISNSITEPSSELSGQYDLEAKQVNGPDLPLFNFNAVATATNNFSEQNKLGQGGFGPVYKGKLPGGQEIAVKRLSRKSGQGLEEFKNELVLIAKLQHRNLVRLLGYCIKGEEKMLIYEYMPNRSLDKFLFNQSKQNQLDWRKRFQIIEGVARGLLYLHRDSRLRIIHRDLKASNILLDEEMNPKISDFGMARIFGGNQDEANTTRVVGTYGYMSPEYAMEGLFSIKSDVYSFGVLLLEIVSGRRNIGFRSPEQSNLIGQAWQLWNEGKVMELVDPSIASSCLRDEVKRCIHVGMLCVQDSAAQRPTMSSVILLLESEAASLPLPRQPTFTSKRSDIDSDHYFDENDVNVSLNNASITRVVGR
ncbi:G-type lectin S-receptor-like serine/threonine-protein kinase B120 isoform X2 [Punica granatum]|uniref:Receptor-like serine/threonine-protein kinase n=1 Tax=Punica granatum TaxID=22663 RepID=A0A218Y234_PUNGR|nr:G-type lectin S-receptor-like serine/threonine-protein kinase B120 isoform X2 [Punica granatum]OWM91333.1 hypothetical protein CDL15_Pgr000277 [Punica granatum]